MRNINLLPKVPFLTKHLRSLTIGTVAVLLLGTFCLFGASYVMGITAVSKEEAASQMRLQAAFWQDRHSEDPRMQLYESYKATAEQLSAARTDWVSRIESITSGLPGSARIVEIDTDKDAMTQLSLQFADMEGTAAYLAGLQLNSDVAAFDIVDMAKREVIASPLPQAVNEQEPAPETPAVPRPSESYYEDLLKDLSVAEDENEALLNELQWMFEKEIAKTSFGIQLPDLPSTDDGGDADWDAVLDSSDQGAITDEEYEAARARWNAYARQRDNLAQMDRDREANMALDPDGSVIENETNVKMVTIYEVTIVLSWTQPAGTEGATVE
jgi:hypothetical protein